MDFSHIMEQLADASLFDLYRLSAAIGKELDNHIRNEEIRILFRVGDNIEYFARDENRLIEAKILEIKRTRALVQNKHDCKKWDIPFYMINIDGIPVDITRSTSSKGLDRNEVKIGDMVGFQDRDGNNVQGKVIRTNPKSVTLFVEPNQKWRVSYSILYAIIDEDKSNVLNLPEGVTVIDNDR